MLSFVSLLLSLLSSWTYPQCHTTSLLDVLDTSRHSFHTSLDSRRSIRNAVASNAKLITRTPRDTSLLQNKGRAHRLRRSQEPPFDTVRQGDSQTRTRGHRDQSGALRRLGRTGTPRTVSQTTVPRSEPFARRRAEIGAGHTRVRTSLVDPRPNTVRSPLKIFVYKNFYLTTS